MGPIIASFWVLRPEEHPEAAARNYPGMLQILDRSCSVLGLHHVVLTDHLTITSREWPAGIVGWSIDLPGPLMKACTEAQARWLETMRDGGGEVRDTLFVGADCIFLQDPAKFYPEGPDLFVTYRNSKAQYPINTGAQYVRAKAIGLASELYRRIADRCGTTWCDDQRAIREELEPMPLLHGVYKRADMNVAFLPMERFNVVPRSVWDPCARTCMLHFRGKRRKGFFFDWAKAHGYSG